LFCATGSVWNDLDGRNWSFNGVLMILKFWEKMKKSDEFLWFLSLPKPSAAAEQWIWSIYSFTNDSEPSN
jgi:hypothetical protein